MLKITAMDCGDRQALVLEGKLADPWLIELRKSWGELQQACGRRQVLIDLKDVTVISQNGEDLLFEMMREGATFKCRGVLARHVVKQLELRHEEQYRKRQGTQ